MSSVSSSIYQDGVRTWFSAVGPTYIICLNADLLHITPAISLYDNGHTHQLYIAVDKTYFLVYTPIYILF